MNNQAQNPNPAPMPTPEPSPNPAPVPPVQPINLESSPSPAPEPNPVPAPEPTPMPTPVNPIINPGGGTPVQPIAATEPIAQPEPVAPPDPIEEELKAPMKAAGPVPGSIGSAVSMPPVAEGAEMPMGAASAGGPQSVAFNDPATQPEANPNAPAAKQKKKMDKKTLTMLAIVAGMIVIALVATLVFMNM